MQDIRAEYVPGRTSSPATPRRWAGVSTRPSASTTGTSRRSP